MILIRPSHQNDWNAIGALANRSVTHLAGDRPQDDWLANRKAFTASRHHYVAMHRKEVVGYCRLEQSGPAADGWRMFLLLDWSAPQHQHLARILFDQINETAGQQDIDQIWLREYADDQPFIDFLAAQDFEPGDPFRHGDEQLIILRGCGPFGFMNRRTGS